MRLNAASWPASLRIGLISIFHRLHINPVIVGVRTNPFNENDLPPVVYCDYQTERIPFDIEYCAIASNDAGIRIAVNQVGRRMPFCALHFVKPSIERRFHSSVVSASAERMAKITQRLSGYDSHELGLAQSATAVSNRSQQP